MDKSLLILICAIAGLIILGFAVKGNAEKYSDSIDLEIPDDALFTKKNCQWKSIGDHLRYSCDWIFDYQKAKQWIEEQDEKFQEELQEQLEEIEEQKQQEEEPLTPTERLIERLEEDKKEGFRNVADEQLLKLLKTLNDKCYFGIEEGLPIQKFGQFLLPDYDPRSALYGKALDLSNYPHLGKILKLLEACESWTKYKAENLRQYLDIEHDSFIRSDITSHAHAAEGIDPVPSQKFYPELVKSNEQRAKLTICSTNYYGDAYKKQQGCTLVYGSEIKNFKDPRQLTEIQKEAHKRAGQICDPKYNFPMSYKLDMGCQLLVTPEYDLQRSENVDMSTNKVFQDWFYYDSTGEDKQLQKVKQKNLAKYLESRK